MKLILIIGLLVPIMACGQDLYFKNILENLKQDEDKFYSLNLNNISQGQIFSLKKHFTKRIELRERLISSQNKSSPLSNDNIHELFPRVNIETNIFNLKSNAKLNFSPWSDDYWPIYKGVLGARYEDYDFSEIYDWKEALNYIQENPLHQNMDEGFINSLSPSEKFDLLYSSYDTLPLTKNMWSDGKQYFEAYGEVEQWMGICHGWAPASFMVPRPTKPITVPSADGQFQIKFYPADLKALASLLWANNRYENYFIGGRCRSKEPETNEDDRLLAQDCLDNNPASFHLALTNGIGEQNQSFVMDATYDYEVWNQPVVGYSMRFFNIKSKEELPKLEENIVDINQYKNDPFQKYRSNKAKYLVGVFLEVEYGVETSPAQLNWDGPDLDETHKARYIYDLELNENYEVIGGEWYNHQHPDFLWRPATDAQALSSYDFYLLGTELWNGKSPLPEGIQDISLKASRQNRPLAYLINSLIQLSNKQNDSSGEQ